MFQPSIFRCKLLVSGRVRHLIKGWFQANQPINQTDRVYLAQSVETSRRVWQVSWGPWNFRLDFLSNKIDFCVFTLISNKHPHFMCRQISHSHGSFGIYIYIDIILNWSPKNTLVECIHLVVSPNLFKQTLSKVRLCIPSNFRHHFKKVQVQSNGYGW